MLEPQEKPFPPGELLLPAPAIKRQRRARLTANVPAVRTIWRFLKAWSWRVTAAWIWLHWILRFFSGRDRLFIIERASVLRLEHSLTWLGFSPTNTAVFPELLKIAWFAVITNFSIIQLFWLFAVYIPTFPVTAVVIRFFGGKYRTEVRKNELKTGLRTSRRRTRVSGRVALLLLSGWLLLYAGSFAKLPELLGLSLAGIFFIERSYSAFLFAGAVEQVRGDIFSVIAEGTGKLSLKAAGAEAGQKPLSYLKLQLRIEQYCYGWTRRTTWLIRGSKGRSRAAMLVLLQYTFNLLVLGGATVLFWSLAMRLTSTQNLSVENALIISAARVLPGLETTRNGSLPLWVDAGSSMSAWILFVVYAGPAASIFPMVQQAYVAAITDAYLKLRSSSLSLMRHVRDLQLRIAIVEAAQAASAIE